MTTTQTPSPQDARVPTQTPGTANALPAISLDVVTKDLVLQGTYSHWVPFLLDGGQNHVGFAQILVDMTSPVLSEPAIPSPLSRRVEPRPH